MGMSWEGVTPWRCLEGGRTLETAPEDMVVAVARGAAPLSVHSSLLMVIVLKDGESERPEPQPLLLSGLDVLHPFPQN